MSRSARGQWIQPQGELSISEQCQLAGLSRSGWYYPPASESQENLQLMRLLEEQYTRHPFLGVRRLTPWLRRQGWSVKPKRVRRLLRQMGLMAIYPKPRLSMGNQAHRPYPYLLPGAGNPSTRPGLGRGHYLYPLIWWICVSGSRDGLV